MLHSKFSLTPRFLTGVAITSLSVLLLANTAIAAGERPDGEKPYVTANDPWYKAGRAALQERLALQPNTNRAKNVILFVADGMGISTITAARIYDGQSRGETGEENSLSFERFPYAALVKTYNTDSQVPDSAGTASALNTGVKTRIGMIGTPSGVKRDDCAASLMGHPANMGELAKRAGKSVGVVSTSLIVDATPSAVYAHSPDRGWMFDSRIPTEAKEAGCKDIALQMLEFGPEVALGGGRVAFYPTELADPENVENKGGRSDGRDLTSEWTATLGNAAYVWNSEGFDAVDLSKTDHLLGLFEPATMQFEADREQDAGGEPSLTEMTKAALEILSRNDEGYYLMVEGGRVDHAHHGGNAYRALADTQEFAEAVQAAVDMVDLEETLILVTADHSHVFTIAGYPMRGNPILGLVKTLNDDGKPENTLAEDGKPYTTLGYWNGPGAVSGERPDLSDVDTTALDYRQQSIVPTRSETHGGEDVALFATGPWAHLASGVMEQNVIFHIMTHAMGLDETTE